MWRKSILHSFSQYTIGNCLWGEYAYIRYLTYVKAATLPQQSAVIAYIGVIVDSLSRLTNMSNVKTGANDPSAQQKEQSTSEVADITWSANIPFHTVL